MTIGKNRHKFPREGDLVWLRTDRDRRLGCNDSGCRCCGPARGLLVRCTVEEGGPISWWDVLVSDAECGKSRSPGLVAGVSGLDIIEVIQGAS